MKITNWNNLTEREKKQLLMRPNATDKNTIREKTQDILNAVKTGGDDILISLTAKYDRAQLKQLTVTAEEFQKAFQAISADAKQAILFAKTQLETNHQAQLPKNHIIKTCEGIFCERQARPIPRVGLYIPGGSAPLVSTVLMLAIPAKIAGCPLKILCTPPNEQGEIDPHLLYAAELCGIELVYKIGGAQAIAAMAYGTETIPKVDKIFGPGNAWVTQAKILVSQDSEGASIDMPAGPSEVMVIADDNANPDFVAADLLSQAEHGPDSQVMLITLSEEFARSVSQATKTQLEKLPRRHIATQSLSHSQIILAQNIEQAIEISNCYAPEHLILQITHPEKYVDLIQNAGAVFLGRFAAETLGDYVTGSNHVLPTNGYARSISGLSVTDFLKFISFQTVTRAGLEKVGCYAEKLAEIEGLHAHQYAVSLRLAEVVTNE